MENTPKQGQTENLGETVVCHLTPERPSFPQIDEEDLLQSLAEARPPLELQHPGIAGMVAEIKAQTEVCDWGKAKDIDIVIFALQFLRMSATHPQVGALVLEFLSVMHERRNAEVAEAVRDVAKSQ